MTRVRREIGDWYNHGEVFGSFSEHRIISSSRFHQDFIWRMKNVLCCLYEFPSSRDSGQFDYQNSRESWLPQLSVSKRRFLFKELWCFWVIPCQLTHFFPGPSPILMKFGGLVDPPERQTHTKLQLIIIIIDEATATSKISEIYQNFRLWDTKYTLTRKVTNVAFRVKVYFVPQSRFFFINFRNLWSAVASSIMMIMSWNLVCVSLSGGVNTPAKFHQNQRWAGKKVSELAWNDPFTEILWWLKNIRNKCFMEWILIPKENPTELNISVCTYVYWL